MDTEQVSNSTKYNRYPSIFKAVQRVAGSEPLRILSFGCSTGQEPRTLSELYFPQSKIIAVDICEDAMMAARSTTAHLPNVTILPSDPEVLNAQGPYDLVFAMSVLCRWPIAKRMEDLSELFSFSRFEASAWELIKVLKPDGLLILHNGSYSLTQSHLIRFLNLVLTPLIAEPGQVTRFGPDGRKLSLGGLATDCIFRKREAPWPDAASIPLKIENHHGRTVGTIWLSMPCRLPEETT